MLRSPARRLLGLALASGLGLGGCGTTVAAPPPLRFERASDAATLTTVVAPDLFPCRRDPRAGVTIDVDRPVVVLVHGCHSSPERLAPLARALESEGQQAVCFRYDDHESLEDSARRLVAALQALKPHLASRHITVLGHSQGGLIARRALVRDRDGALPDDDGFRYELITVSSPFHGIQSSAGCGSVLLHVFSLGATAVVCRAVAGAMWSEIYPQSSFMRHPGHLLASVDRHFQVVTDERRACRRRDPATGRCVRRDFVFTLAEQVAPAVESDPRASYAVVEAGHAEIVGEEGGAPVALMRLLRDQSAFVPATRPDGHLGRPGAPARWAAWVGPTTRQP